MKNNMKKLISFLLSAFMLFSFTACSSELTEEDYSDIISAVGDIAEGLMEEDYDAWDSEEYSETEDVITEETAEDDAVEIPDETEIIEEIPDDTEEITEQPVEETVTETTTTSGTSPPETEEPEPAIDFDGTYTSKDDVALYIYTYGCLPQNFISKKEAQKLGWEGGSLEPYAPGMCIGGSYFGNYEGLLPEKDGRKYTECDIDTLGKKSRGAKRIVFSNDGLIYYTDDHYESFELLYGEE